MLSRDFEARSKSADSKAPLNEVLRDDSQDEDHVDDDEDPGTAVARAEARAREEQRMVGTKRRTNVIVDLRSYAESLHRQADRLHHRGDYEAALILYHRAASAYPRDLSHDVAARRTAAAISSAATNPSRAQRNVLPAAKDTSQLTAIFCPETAALRAKKIVEESPDPVSSISQILKYFDSRKDFWRDSLTFQDQKRTRLLPGSKIMSTQLSGLASIVLKDLQAAYASGDFNKSLKTGDELLTVSEALPNRYRYQVAARHYLAMTQISLRRHDRAVDQVSRMLRLSRESGDVALRSRSMMTLGKVHLSFGHLDAAARAWERLVVDVGDAVPKAWLLHEIGRCYFEMKRYAEALEIADRCVEYADEGNSRKWLMHGKLLSGQSLVELGRLGEAVGALRVASGAARDEQDSETREYLSSLIDEVTAALRRAVCTGELVERNANSAREKPRKSRSDEILSRNGQTNHWLDGTNGGKILARMASTRKSRISVDGSFGKAKSSRASQDARIKNPKSRNKRVRKSTDGFGNSRLSMSRSRGSGAVDLKLAGVDVEGLESGKKPGIPANPRRPRVADPSSLPRDDLAEVEDDGLTSGTRVFRRTTAKDRISTEQLGRLDEGEHFAGQKADSAADDEPSGRTGETYAELVGNCESKVARISRHPGEADVSSGVCLLGDADVGGELASGSRAVSRETGNSTVRLFDGGKIAIDDDADFSPDDEQSARTGETYVLNETDDMTTNQSRSTAGGENLDVRVGNEFPDKSEIIHEPEFADNSKYAGYSFDTSRNDLAIFLARRREGDDGIDEVAEEDAENEEVEEEEEEEAFSPGHRTVVSSCESKLSVASTGRTYVVRETRTMSQWETARRYVGYEEKMRSPGRHDSPGAFGPSPPYSRSRGDAKIIGDVGERTGDERCEIDTSEVADTLGDRLVIADLIPSPRSHGRRSLYRHSLPSGSRKESRTEVVASITSKQ